MNILLITPHFSPAVGGVETHLDDLCSYFNIKAYNVYVRTYKAWGVKHRGLSEEKRGGIYIHRMWWPDLNLFFKLENYPLLRFLFVSSGIFIDSFFFLLQNRKKIDVIQTHGFSAASTGVILGKLFKKKVIINTHVWFKVKRNLIGKLIGWIIMNADKILVLTNGIKKSLIDSGIPEDKIQVYHYWVDHKLFYPIRSAKKILGWNNKFIVLFVGRLIEEKGVKLIFKLAKDLRKVTFVIIGPGPLEKEISKISNKFGNVIFIGRIDNNKLPIYYSASDILLIPTQLDYREYNEGIPRVIIEALFCRLPVISTKSGGIPDIFSEKVGKLVEDDLFSIKKAVNIFYQDRKRLRENSRNCRAFALQCFSVKNAQIIENSLLKGK